MALSQKHRSTIYQQLAPIIGDEETEALLSQFPSRDLDEPVTKEFVRAEITDVRAEFADVRAEMHAGFADVRAEFADVRAEMHAGFAAARAEFAVVRAEIADVRAELRAAIADVRAEMHAGFGDVRAEMHAGFDAIHDRFRQQTIWIASATVIAAGIAAGLGRL